MKEPSKLPRLTRAIFVVINNIDIRLVVFVSCLLLIPRLILVLSRSLVSVTATRLHPGKVGLNHSTKYGL